MKAKFNLDQFANASTCTEAQRELLAFVPGRDRYGKPASIAIFPAGAIAEGAWALSLCRTGQASPADDECAKALGLSAHEIASLQIDYQMDTLGIKDKGDRELYRSGVITGYQKHGEKIEYKHGPKWDEYQAAIAAAEDIDDDIGLSDEPDEDESE
tara:strand:- start:658 stop:1125 length:468 start_codon:yes stop_codon:yes gene_type:complete